MAKVVTDDIYYKNIADTLRARGVGWSELTIKPAEMPSTIKQLVENNYTEGEHQGFAEGWQMGYDDGFTAGEQSGIVEGKQSEYDRFWDFVQNNGMPCSYNNAFSGVTWNKNRFNPKYTITPDATSSSAREMFAYFNIGELNPNNMAELTYDMTDMSRCTSSGQVYSMFANATFKYIEIDLSGVVGLLSNIFTGNNGGRIYNIRAKINATGFSGCFNNLTMLETLILEDGSVIGGNGFNVQWSTKLSHNSIVSIINALYSTTSGVSVTLSKAAVNTAFETSTGAADGSTAAEWVALATTKSNWTINLV